MSYTTSKIPKDDRSYFRCPVVGDKGKATLRVGLSTIKTTVVEASNGGYTIAVSKRYAKKLARSKRDWLIAYDDTQARVRREWVSDAQDGTVKIGLLLVQDLTKPEKITSPILPRLKVKFGDSDTASIAYGGFVIVLFLAMALPGLGDRLGTSDQIQDTVRWLLDGANQQVELWSR